MIKERAVDGIHPWQSEETTCINGLASIDRLSKREMKIVALKASSLQNACRDIGSRCAAVSP